MEARALLAKKKTCLGAYNRIYVTIGLISEVTDTTRVGKVGYEIPMDVGNRYRRNELKLAGVRLIPIITRVSRVSSELGPRLRLNHNLLIR